ASCIRTRLSVVRLRPNGARARDHLLTAPTAPLALPPRAAQRESHFRLLPTALATSRRWWRRWATQRPSLPAPRAASLLTATTERRHPWPAIDAAHRSACP